MNFVNFSKFLIIFPPKMAKFLSSSQILTNQSTCKFVFVFFPLVCPCNWRNTEELEAEAFYVREINVKNDTNAINRRKKHVTGNPQITDFTSKIADRVSSSLPFPYNEPLFLQRTHAYKFSPCLRAELIKAIVSTKGFRTNTPSVR